MHPLLFKIKYQNLRPVALGRSATVFEDDRPMCLCWSVSFYEDGKSWIETKFATRETAEKRKQNFMEGE